MSPTSYRTAPPRVEKPNRNTRRQSGSTKRARLRRHINQDARAFRHEHRRRVEVPSVPRDRATDDNPERRAGRDLAGPMAIIDEASRDVRLSMTTPTWPRGRLRAHQLSNADYLVSSLRSLRMNTTSPGRMRPRSCRASDSIVAGSSFSLRISSRSAPFSRRSSSREA